MVVEASSLVGGTTNGCLTWRSDNPLIVGFIGHLDPNQPEFVANLKRFGTNPLFRGLRFDHIDMLAKGLWPSRF